MTGKRFWKALRFAVGFLVGFVLVWVLTSCSETHKDAPEPAPADIVNGTHTQVIKMPDGFRNVAFTCYGTTGIYITSRGVYQANNNGAVFLPSSIAVQPNDVKCK